jgi:hypothetical protein
MKGYRYLFWVYQVLFFNTASSSTVCQKMLGLNPGLLRLRHRQSDALTIRPNLIHSRLCLIPTRLYLIQIRLDLIHYRTRLVSTGAAAFISSLIGQTTDPDLYIRNRNRIRCNKKWMFLRQESHNVVPSQ